MARRYKTESMSVREELAKISATAPCAGCGGSRLRPEARNVYIGNINCHKFQRESIGESLGFQGLTLTGQKHKLKKILKRDQRAVRIF